MTTATQAELVDAITGATRSAVMQLFAEHPDHSFYFVALVTTDEAHPPFLTAWSHEALAAVPEADRWAVEWSYADSPFDIYGEEHFEEVARLFATRPGMDEQMTCFEWAAEQGLRLAAMEQAMARLEAEALFGVGEDRLGIVVNVETVPPDFTNVLRARRLNPPGALGRYPVEPQG